MDLYADQQEQLGADRGSSLECLLERRIIRERGLEKRTVSVT